MLLTTIAVVVTSLLVWPLRALRRLFVIRAPTSPPLVRRLIVVGFDGQDPTLTDEFMDPDAVPGVLLTSRALRKPASSLQALAAAIVAEFGIEDFPRWRKEK